MDPAICADVGGCWDDTPAYVPPSAYEVVVDDMTFTIIPDVPEYTVDRETLYSWGELKRR